MSGVGNVSLVFDGSYRSALGNKRASALGKVSRASPVDYGRKQVERKSVKSRHDSPLAVRIAGGVGSVVCCTTGARGVIKLRDDIPLD